MHNTSMSINEPGERKHSNNFKRVSKNFFQLSNSDLEKMLSRKIISRIFYFRERHRAPGYEFPCLYNTLI